MPVYESWPGADGDPLPSARWDVVDYTDGTIEQTGDGRALLLGGPNGGYNANDGVPIRSVESFDGEVRWQVTWPADPSTELSLQAAFCVQDTGAMMPWEVYATNAYYLVHSIYAGSITFVRRIDGSGEFLSAGETFASLGLTAPGTGAAEVTWNYAASADGTTAQVWIWDVGDPRPEEPTFEATDSTYSSGKLRFTVPGAGAPAGGLWIGPVEYEGDEPEPPPSDPIVFLGALPVAGLAVGGSPITAVMLGSTQVWPTFLTPPSSDRFQAVDGGIIDPDGAPFYPVGMNTGIKIASYAYVHEHPSNLGTVSSYEHDPVTYPSRVPQAEAWNLNFFRCGLITYNLDPGGPTPDGPLDLLPLIRHGVNELLDAGFVVMLESHDFLASANESIVGTAKYDAVMGFWEAVVDEWGDNPYLWINPWNEPYQDNTASLTYWIELHEDTVTKLRSYGYLGPIVCDIPRWAQGIDLLGAGDLDEFAGVDDNLIFAWHAYGIADENVTNTWQTHEDHAVAAKNRGHTILCGELGVASPPSAGDGPWQFNEVALDWAVDRARDLDIGVVWWHACHPSYMVTSANLPFWTSTDGSGLTVHGEAFWDFTRG